MQPYLSMAGNNAWANATLFAALSDLDAAAFAAPRPGFFGSLKATLNHIHQVDLYYIDALEQGGAGRAVFAEAEHGDVTTLAAAQAETDARLIHFCTALTSETLRETRQTERRGGPVAETVGALLPHLFQHQVHQLINFLKQRVERFAPMSRRHGCICHNVTGEIRKNGGMNFIRQLDANHMARLRDNL